jgi:hypothetical protein
MTLAVLMPYAIYWELPVVIILISLVYSATRFDDWGSILSEAFRWARNMLIFLAAIGLVLYVISFWT